MEIHKAKVLENKSWLIGILFFFLGVVLYAPTLTFSYCLDDRGSITGNYLVKGGLRNIATIFSTEYRYGIVGTHPPEILYRPLTLSVFALEQQIAPEKPWFFHAVNVLFYGLTGWLLWATWRRILIRYSPLLPFLAVLFFLAHPIHTEVVANIKSLDEILGLLFNTLALYGVWRFNEEGKRIWLVLALTSFTFAVFSKESSLAFLAIIPLALLFFSNKPLSRIAKISAWFLLPAVLFLSVRTWVVFGLTEPEGIRGITNIVVLAPTFFSRLATAFAMVWRYITVLVFPHPLVSDMSYPQVKAVTFGDLRALAGLTILSLMAAMALFRIGRRPLPSFAVLFFLISFAPVSNLFLLIPTHYAERVLYTPSLAFSLLLAWFLFVLFPKATSQRIPQIAFGCIVGIGMVFYIGKTLWRIPDWKNHTTLANADIRTSPNSFLLMRNYGIQCLNESIDSSTGLVKDFQLLQKSIDIFTKAIEMDPANTEMLDNRAIAYMRQSKFDEAIADFERSLAIHPNNPVTLTRLGTLYWNRQGKQEKAQEFLQRALALDPRFIEPYLFIGRNLKERGKVEEAVRLWEKALQYSPDHIVLHRLLGETYLEMGKMQLGTTHLTKSRQLERDHDR